MVIFAVVLLTLCCAAPVAGAGAWFLPSTLAASQGPAYPGVAVIEFMHAAFGAWGEPDQLINVVCDKREDDILREAKAYRAELDAYARRCDSSYQLTLLSHTADEHGDRATLRSGVEIVWTERPKPGQDLGATQTLRREWSFDLVKEGGLDPGWKVCRFARRRSTLRDTSTFPACTSSLIVGEGGANCSGRICAVRQDM